MMCDLLHRKILALIGAHNLLGAEKLINDITSRNKDLRVNPDIAALEGRIHREIWEQTDERAQLDAAFAAYYRAYQADTTQYYPAINAAELALFKGDTQVANQLFQAVLGLCHKELQRQNVTYWVDFTYGAAYLGLGEVDTAVVAYAQGLKRNPAPSPRDQEFAARGAIRMASAKRLPLNAVDEVKKLLGSGHH